MNLDKIRNKVYEYINVPCKFIYKGSRNQVEEFNGMIVRCFPYIFLIKTEKGHYKSFSYSDFIIKNIIIAS